MIKRILVITPTYPPYQGSHTERMLALITSLRDGGFDVAVLTTEVNKNNPAYNGKLDHNYDSDITIFRAPFGFIHKLSYSSKKSYSSIKNADDAGAFATPLKSKIKREIVKWIERAKTLFLIPDSLIDWYFSAIKYCKDEQLIDIFRPDAIISCSMPNTCHLIGYSLSKKYNLPLFMDVADPWAYISYYKHGKIGFLLDRHMEKKILDYASLISFSTNGCEQLYHEKYGIDKNKTLTIVTGYNEQLLLASEQFCNSIPFSHKVTLLYGGAVSSGGRDPIPFIDAVSSFDSTQLEFKLRTDNPDAAINMLPTHCDNIVIDSYIPFDSFFEEMMQSDVLVFFGNATTDQLPGKIFNYIATGKLILYISNTRDNTADQCHSIINDYGNCIISSNDYDSLVEAINTIMELKKNNKLNKEVNKYSILKYSSKKQFEQLIHAINTIHAINK